MPLGLCVRIPYLLLVFWNFPIPTCLNFQVGSPYVGSSSNNTGASRMSAPAMNSDQPKIGLKEGINKGLLSFIFLS